MVDETGNNNPTRRGVLQAAALALAPYFIVKGLGEPIANNTLGYNLGDESRPTNQADVTKLYNELFEKISKEKEEADKKGKKLTILLGENHNNRDALLVNLMIIDIASKIGVKNLVHEALAEKIDGLQIADQDVLKKFPESMRFFPAIQHFSEIFSVHDRLKISKEKPSEQHTGSISFALRTGMNCINGEVSRTVNKLNPSNEIREAEMFSIMSGLKADSVAIFGAEHMPNIYDHIKDEYHVMALNVANMKYRDVFSGEIHNRLNKEFPKVVVQGKEVDEKQIFEFVLMASLEHDLRSHRGGINQDIPLNEATINGIMRDARKTIYEKAPELMGPMPRELGGPAGKGFKR